MTRVLLTRPLEASLQLAGQLNDLGLHPIVMPFYTFLARTPELDLQRLLTGKTGRCLAVFTSPRAVQFGLEHIRQASLEKMEIAAVGNATRNRLEAAGCKVQLRADSGYTSEDLLAMSELAEDPGVAVIFCAPGGRDVLRAGLRVLGWEVNNAFVYERRELQVDTKQLEKLVNANNLLSVWTSVSALELARKHLPEEAWEKILDAPVLVISDRIKHHLQQLGATSIEMADGPGNVELLRSIRQITGRV